jgi:cell division protein FtsN
VTEIPADPGQSEPSIHASISSTDDGKAGSAAPAETDGSPEPRKSHRNSRHTGDETSAASVQDGTDASPDPEMKSRVSGIPKARTHRLSPLEALPPLDSDGSAPSKEQDNSDGIDVSPATPAPAADHDPHKPGRSYRVQVGRYTDPAEAERVKADLAKAGMATQVVRSQKDGVTQYRVQVGTFKQRENADRQMDRLRALQYSPYIADEEP